MKKFILGMMALGLLQVACDEPTPHIIFPPEDSTLMFQFLFHRKEFSI